MESFIIETKQLTKKYKGQLAVNNVNLHIKKGSIYGLLGRNGAGKTTTLKSLLDFVHPDAGEALFFGRPLSADEFGVKQAVGFASGGFGFYPLKRLRTVTDVTRRFYPSWDETAYRRYLALFALDENKRVKELSEGMKVKYALALALSHRARLLVLDEPTSGLDPLMQSRFIDLVLEEKRRGATILLSSHLFDEVERTCDRVAFIRAGRMAAVERMDDVRKSRKRVFAVTFADEAARDRFAQAHPDARKQGAASVEAAVAGNPDAFVKDLAAYDIVDLSAREQTLEELFMHLYGTTNQVEKGGSHE